MTSQLTSPKKPTRLDAPHVGNAGFRTVEPGGDSAVDFAGTRARESRSSALRDWRAIEFAYRAGQLSIREIARQHQVSDTAIRKRAGKGQWSRTLVIAQGHQHNARPQEKSESEKIISLAEVRDAARRAATGTTSRALPPLRRRPRVDWGPIEAAYREGRLSIRQLAREHGISDTGIRKRANQGRWSRELDPMRRQTGRKTLAFDGRIESAGSQQSSQVTPQSNARAREDDAIVEFAAARGIDVICRHRETLQEVRQIFYLLLAELNFVNDNIDEIVGAIEEETKGDRGQRRRQKLLRSVDLLARARTLYKLCSVVAKVIPLERKAYGLDDKPRHRHQTL